MSDAQSVNGGCRSATDGGKRIAFRRQAITVIVDNCGAVSTQLPQLY
jgi:hypothetical protein